MSTAFSKFFKEHIQSRNCQNLIHAESCLEYLKKDFVLYMISNLKYFAPVCMVSILESIILRYSGAQLTWELSPPQKKCEQI